MDNRFSAYNNHRLGLATFQAVDPQLRQLQQQTYTYHSPIINQLPHDVPGIYTLGGGRQIGKSTLLKQWIANLLAKQVDPQAITFLSGELIDDHHALVDILQDIINEQTSSTFRYIIIDEVTYIATWDRAIKFAADAGYFHNCIVVLTGSDLSLMQAARMTFPGRRGQADQVDFHIYPLSFKECLQLKKSIPHLSDCLSQKLSWQDHDIKTIYSEFYSYLQHGGYLTAINDMAKNNTISIATLKTYSDWIRGDVLKHGKQETYLKEILSAIIKHYNKQISWHNLASNLSIDSHKTVADYCELLTLMDALFIQSALLIDKLTAAPKKARKLTFTDPFIYHAIKYWLQPTADINQRITDDINQPTISADLVEATVSNHYRRYYPTYYIKNEHEVDIAYIHHHRYWPIEIKWRNQLRPNDIKSIKKYPNIKLFAKPPVFHTIENIPVEPLPIALLYCGSDHQDE